MGDSTAAAAYHAEDDFSVAELDAHLFTPHHERIDRLYLEHCSEKMCVNMGRWVGGWVGLGESHETRVGVGRLWH